MMTFEVCGSLQVEKAFAMTGKGNANRPLSIVKDGVTTTFMGACPELDSGMEAGPG
jgi:hypothetical protein